MEIIFLPPYSPDFNPIKGRFREVKDFIRKEWYTRDTQGLPFSRFLEWYINLVGVRLESAEGHFAILALRESIRTSTYIGLVRGGIIHYSNAQKYAR